MDPSEEELGKGMDPLLMDRDMDSDPEEAHWEPWKATRVPKHMHSLAWGHSRLFVSEMKLGIVWVENLVYSTDSMTRESCKAEEDTTSRNNCPIPKSVHSLDNAELLHRAIDA